MSVGAGRRDQKIKLQRPVSASSGFGSEAATTWTDLCTEWAAVTYGTAAERRSAAAEGATQTATFTFLWNSKTRALTPRDRLLLDGQPWNINGVTILPRNSGVAVTAILAKD